MSKKAFFKKLLIAGMCVISATATAGLVASCSFEKPNQNQTQTTKYTVKYENNNIGEKPKDLTNTTKLPATLPVLTDENYNFEGWFTDSEFKKPAVEGAAIEKDTTLYAKWTPKHTPPPVTAYTITFVTEHGTKPQDLTNTEKLPDTLPVLTDGDYDFEGWFTDSNYKTPAVAGTTIDKATTLYAKWTAKPPVITTYKITYVTEHGTKPQDLTEQTKLPDTLPVLTDGDYDFGGWFTDSNYKTPAVAGTTIDKATTLYAKWTAKPPVIKTYTITYVSEHGNKPQDLTEQTKLPDTLPELTDADYDFEGWFTDSNYKTPAVAGATIDKATTLYAKWTAKPPVIKTYTITFVSEHGTKPANLTEQTKLPDTLPVLTDADYDFGGWFTDSGYKTPAVAGATIDKATTLYAKWTAKPPVITTYKITYVTEHGTKPQDLTEQTKLPATLPVLTDGDYDFGGWFTDSDYKTPAVAGATIDKATTLYAKWTAKPPVITTYKITYVTEHGTKPQDLTEQTKLPDTLPVLTDADYDFGGWFTDSNYKTPAVAGTTIDKATTLYAKWTAKPPVITTYTITFVSEHGTKPANLTEQTKLPDTLPVLTDDDYDFGGWFTDSEYKTPAVAGTTIDKATTLYAKWTAKQVTPPPASTYQVSFDMHGIGTAPTAQSVTPGQKATMPPSPTASGYTFKGWYTSDYFTEEFDFANTTITADTTVYACWLETVTRKLDHGKAQRAAGLADGGTLQEDLTYNDLKYERGTIFEAKSTGFTSTVINTQGKKVYLTLTTDATVTFKARNAGGNMEGSKIRIYSVDDKGNATVVSEKSFSSSNAEEFKFQNLSAGNYYIVYEVTSNNSGNAMRMGEISVTEKLVVSDAESISVTLLNNEYLCGTAFDEDTVTVKLRYKSGREDVLDASKYTVDKSQFKSNESGKHSISVSYNDDSNVEAKSAEVFVYKINSIEVYDYYLTKDRVTVNLQKIYKKGNAFDTDGLVVRADCSVTGFSDKAKTFTLDISQVDINYGSMAATGKKTVTVTEKLSSSNKKTASYEINVVDLTNADKKLVKVDASASSVSVNSGVLVVKTINDALCAIKLLGASTSEQKVIEVAAGTYKEKVEVNIPNVKIKGTGAKAGDTVLVYDALNGLLDPAGKVGYNTDGSATISIRESAYNFSAENIEFRNYYNTNALYEQSKKVAPSGTQAVAALVQADKVVFNNVRFSSYHDTLYDMTGRHVYENCYIEGRTDYIFGYNSTAYFHNTTLMTLGANKDKNNLTEKNGGYVVATKGINRGGDNVTYGYIFDGCTFTADEYVTPGTVSFARAWDKYMTMMVMNSTISGAYSKDALNASSGKNKRYEKMSGTSPNASLLFEYNNTGDGAISSSLSNTCTVLTDKSKADKFANFTEIFAAVNGNQKYSDDWDGSVEISNNDDLTLTKDTSWNFGKGSGTAYTIEVKDGTTDVFNKLKIAVNSGSFENHGGGWHKILGDATLTMKVKKGATIRVRTYDGNLVMKLNGTAVSPATEGSNDPVWYTYTATEDGELVLSKASGANQTYIGEITYTAP